MSPWRFDITDTAQDDLGKLDVVVRRRIVNKLKWFVLNFDYLTPIPLGEPLKGFFKLRVGDWRIAYEVEDDKKLVTVHAIGRRDNVYKKLKHITKP